MKIYNIKSLPRIGMAKAKNEHQDAIIAFAYRTTDMFAEIGLSVVLEATITPDQNDKIPDIIVFDDNNKRYPVIIIEATTPQYVSRNMRKCIKFLERFPDAVVYVYDFINEIIYVYDEEGGEWISSSSLPHGKNILCAYIDIPILPLFKPIPPKRTFNRDDMLRKRRVINTIGVVEGIEPKKDHVVC